MWMHPEDARTDVILAAATAAFGWFVHDLVSGLGFYPRPATVAGQALIAAWTFALSGLVPLLLARYREEDASAFALDSDRTAALRGAVLAVPIVVVGIVVLWVDFGQSLPRALLGQLGQLPSDPLALLVRLGRLTAVFVGSYMLYAFLTVRSRTAFSRTEISQTEALRTYGMGAAGAVLVLGLLTSLGGICSAASVLTTAAGLTAVVLLADGSVGVGTQTTRATILAPAIVAVVISVFIGGGIFTGNLLIALYQGAAAAGIVIVLAVLVEAGRAWAGVALLLAATLYPSLLTPVAFTPTC